MQFIKSRLNKDNFWNIVFWLGMVLGICFTFWVNEIHKNLGTIAIWTTLLGVPFIVSKGSKVTIDKDLNFFDRNGTSLENRLPCRFGLIIFLTIGVVAIVGAILDSHKNIPELVDSFIISGSIFLVPTLYFICINCPIAVLFKRHMWTIIGKEINFNNAPYQSSASSISKSNSNPITDLSYSSCSFNIHNSRYR